MAIHSIYTLSQDDPEARNWLSFFDARGYTKLTNVKIERVVWLEGSFNLKRLMPLLINPLYQVPSETSQLDPRPGADCGDCLSAGRHRSGNAFHSCRRTCAGRRRIAICPLEPAISIQRA